VNVQCHGSVPERLSLGSGTPSSGRVTVTIVSRPRALSYAMSPPEAGGRRSRGTRRALTPCPRRWFAGPAEDARRPGARLPVQRLAPHHAARTPELVDRQHRRRVRSAAGRTRRTKRQCEERRQRAEPRAPFPFSGGVATRTAERFAPQRRPEQRGAEAPRPTRGGQRSLPGPHRS